MLSLLLLLLLLQLDVGIPETLLVFVPRRIVLRNAAEEELVKVSVTWIFEDVGRKPRIIEADSKDCDDVWVLQSQTCAHLALEVESTTTTTTTTTTYTTYTNPYKNRIFPLPRERLRGQKGLPTPGYWSYFIATQ